MYFRVLQAAFVDIGLDKAAFLHASDIMPHTECVAGEEQKQFTVRDISELVRQGQDLNGAGGERSAWH
ncbi:ribonuclease G [Escherichia coli]|nr:ribonuclease G [Escherichia coli]